MMPHIVHCSAPLVLQLTGRPTLTPAPEPTLTPNPTVCPYIAPLDHLIAIHTPDPRQLQTWPLLLYCLVRRDNTIELAL